MTVLHKQSLYEIFENVRPQAVSVNDILPLL